jgi:two-component system, OmpR family, sensor histidine kinase MtrB
MKLKTAALLFCTVIFGLFVLLGASLIKITSLLDREARDIATAGTSINTAQELKSQLLTHNRNAFLYSLNKNPNRLESGKVLRAEIANLLERMRRLANHEREKTILDVLETEIAYYLEKLERLEISGLTAVDQYNEARKDVDMTLAAVDTLIEFNESQMRQLTGIVGKRNRTADSIGFLILALGSAVLLALTGMMLSMADRLQEKQKEQLRFIAAIAHDLRNPLSSMSMASELLVRKGAEQDRGLADIILRQVKNLDRMTGDLLDTTRIEAGHIDLKLSLHDINALVSDSVQLHRAGSDLHRLRVEIPGEPVFCLCDGGRVSQVINNLISNALKYSPNGGDVTVRLRREKEQIVVAVSDQGIGIAPEELDNLFTPFYRTRATRGTIPGIGLGLSASRRIVESHGGRLKVDSKPGAGSTFYMILPAHAQGPAATRVQNEKAGAPESREPERHDSA